MLDETFQYCIPVLASTATSWQFDNVDRFNYFLRSVPSDEYQVQAIIRLLETMKWHRVAIVHETSNYGRDFNRKFVEQVEQKHKDICIAKNVELSYDQSNNWNTTLDLLDAAEATVILLFMDLPQTRQFFEAAANRSNWLDQHHQFVGIDAWSNQEFSQNSKPIVSGAVTSEPASPIWEPFSTHLLHLTLDEVLQRQKQDFCPEIGDYAPMAHVIAAQNKCNITTTCNGSETLLEVAEGTLIRASHVFDNVYVVGKTLADFCAGSAGNCWKKLSTLTGKIFYEKMKANKINLTNFCRTSNILHAAKISRKKFRCDFRRSSFYRYSHSPTNECYPA